MPLRNRVIVANIFNNLIEFKILFLFSLYRDLYYSDFFRSYYDSYIFFFNGVTKLDINLNFLYIINK